MVGHQVILPEGYRDAKLGMIIAATIGEIVQGEARSCVQEQGEGKARLGLPVHVLD